MTPWIFLISILLYYTPVWSDSNFSGDISVFADSQEKLKDENVTQNHGGLRLTVKDDLRWSKAWSLAYQVFFKSDGLTKSEDEKNLLEPQELNIKWKSTSQNLKIGYSTVVWEGTDFINPMDIVSAKNDQDPLNPLTRSSLGVFYGLNVQGFSLDLIYIPKQSKTLLPGDKSAWWPRQFTLPTNSDETVLLVPDLLKYKIQDEEVLEKALDHNFAVRVKQQFDTWDISLAAFQGSSSVPALTPQINLTPLEIYPHQIYQINSPVVIQPIYYRQRTVAGALTKNFENFIFRFSAQHTLPLTEDARLPGWSNLNVAALEKNISLFNTEVTLLFQYIGSKKQDDGNLSLLSSLTEQALMFGWRWPFAETWTWNAAFFQEQKKYSSFIHSDLSWSISDNWKQNLAVDILSGVPESTLGTYDKNDRGSLSLSYLF